jgi:hypothetical protein
LDQYLFSNKRDILVEDLFAQPQVVLIYQRNSTNHQWNCMCTVYAYSCSAQMLCIGKLLDCLMLVVSMIVAGCVHSGWWKEWRGLVSWAKVSKWLSLGWNGFIGGFSTNYAFSLDQMTYIGNLSIASPEQEISAKQSLVVNLRGAFDTVAAISAQGSISTYLPNLGISFLQ